MPYNSTKYGIQDYASDSDSDSDDSSSSDSSSSIDPSARGPAHTNAKAQSRSSRASSGNDGEPAWMSKFAKPTKRPTISPASTTVLTTSDNMAPHNHPTPKPGLSDSMRSMERSIDVVGSKSAYTPNEMPEWMTKFQQIGQKSDKEQVLEMSGSQRKSRSISIATPTTPRKPSIPSSINMPSPSWKKAARSPASITPPLSISVQLHQARPRSQSLSSSPAPSTTLLGTPKKKKIANGNIANGSLTDSPATDMPEWMKRFQQIGMTNETVLEASSDSTGALIMKKITKANPTGGPPVTTRPKSSARPQRRHSLSASSAPNSQFTSSKTVSHKPSSLVTSAPASPIAVMRPPIAASAPSSPIIVKSNLRTPGSAETRNAKLLSPSNPNLAATLAAKMGLPPLSPAKSVVLTTSISRSRNGLSHSIHKETQAYDNTNETPNWIKKLNRQKHQDHQRSMHHDDDTHDDGSSALSFDASTEEGYSITDEHIANGGHKHAHDHHHRVKPDGDSNSEVPEWMKRYQQMHLQKIVVFSAQGKAPQHVKQIRTASMLERAEQNTTDQDSAVEIQYETGASRRSKRHASSFDDTHSLAQSIRRSVYRESLNMSGVIKFDPPEKDHPPSTIVTKETGGSIGSLRDDYHDDNDNDRRRSASSQDYGSEAGSVSEIDDDDLMARSVDTNDDLLTNDTDDAAPNKPKGPASAVKDVQVTASPRNKEPVGLHNAEIDTSTPDIKHMWGQRIKTKKPGDATMMGFRMIREQQAKFAERLAQHKRAAALEDDNRSLEGDLNGGSSDSISMSNSAAALFGFAGGNGSNASMASPSKRASSSMDNSAARLFGFGGGNDSHSTAASPQKRGSSGMDNSAARLFGFGGGNDSHSTAASPQKRGSSGMDNSAARLFGFGGGNDSQSTAASPQKRSSSAMDNSAARLFGFGGGKSSSDDDDSDSDDGDNNKSASQKREPEGSVSPVPPPQNKLEPSPMHTRKLAVKKSFLDDSSDDSDSDSDTDDDDDGKSKTSNLNQSHHISVLQKASPPTVTKKSLLDDSSDEDSDSDDEDDDDKAKPSNPTQSNQAAAATKPTPPVKKKSFLDDSSAEDSDSDDSDNGKAKPVAKASPPAPAPAKKKSFLDDSSDEDSDSDDEKKEAPKKTSMHGNTSGHSANQSTSASVSASASASAQPKKKSFLDDSSDDDSDSDDDDDKGPAKKANAVAPPKKKSSFLDDSSDDDSDSDDEKEEPKKTSAHGINGGTTAGKPTATPTATQQSEPPKKKSSFLDGSSDDDSDSDDEESTQKEKKAAPPKKKSSFLDDSSDDDSDSDSDSDSDDDKAKSKTKAPAKATTPPAASPKAIPPAAAKKKKSFLDDSSSDDSDSSDDSSSDGEKKNKSTANANAKPQTTTKKDDSDNSSSYTEEVIEDDDDDEEIVEEIIEEVIKDTPVKATAAPIKKDTGMEDHQKKQQTEKEAQKAKEKAEWDAALMALASDETKDLQKTKEKEASAEAKRKKDIEERARKDLEASKEKDSSKKKDKHPTAAPSPKTPNKKPVGGSNKDAKDAKSKAKGRGSEKDKDNDKDKGRRSSSAAPRGARGRSKPPAHHAGKSKRDPSKGPKKRDKSVPKKANDDPKKGARSSSKSRSGKKKDGDSKGSKKDTVPPKPVVAKTTAAKVENGKDSSSTKRSRSAPKKKDKKDGDSKGSKKDTVPPKPVVAPANTAKAGSGKDSSSAKQSRSASKPEGKHKEKDPKVAARHGRKGPPAADKTNGRGQLPPRSPAKKSQRGRSLGPKMKTPSGKSKRGSSVKKRGKSETPTGHRDKTDRPQKGPTPRGILKGMTVSAFPPPTRVPVQSSRSPSMPARGKGTIFARPRSSQKLVVSQKKKTGTMHQQRIEKSLSDDDSFGDMEDFDDDFSETLGFGDFAEDGSIMTKGSSRGRTKGSTIGSPKMMSGARTSKRNFSKTKKPKGRPPSGSSSVSSKSRKDKKSSRKMKKQPSVRMGYKSSKKELLSQLG